MMTVDKNWIIAVPHVVYHDKHKYSEKVYQSWQLDHQCEMAGIRAHPSEAGYAI